jgi:hypothetical protein
LLSGSPRSGSKGEFFKLILVPFMCCCIYMTQTNPSYPGILYLPMPPQSSSCFGLVSDSGGGGAMVAGFQVGALVYYCSLRVKKYLRKKTSVNCSVVVPSEGARMGAKYIRFSRENWKNKNTLHPSKKNKLKIDLNIYIHKNLYHLSIFSILHM